MNPQEQAWQKEVKRLRQRLRTKVTKARKLQVEAMEADHGTRNQKIARAIRAWRSVRDEAEEGMRWFSTNGYPDMWHEWQRAEEDTYWAIRSFR